MGSTWGASGAPRRARGRQVTRREGGGSAMPRAGGDNLEPQASPVTSGEQSGWGAEALQDLGESMPPCGSARHLLLPRGQDLKESGPLSAPSSPHCPHVLLPVVFCAPQAPSLCQAPAGSGCQVPTQSCITFQAQALQWGQHQAPDIRAASTVL